MPFYIQHDENGNISGTIMGQNAPKHERQLEFSEYVDTTDMKVVDGKLVIDEEAIAMREKNSAVSAKINELAAEKLEELVAAKPDNWDDLSVQEKVEIHLGKSV